MKYKFSIQGTIITKEDMKEGEAKNYLSDALDPMEDDEDFTVNVRWHNIKVHRWKNFKVKKE